MQQCVKIVFLQNLGDVKNEVFERKLFFLFFLFYVGKIETEKKKMKMEKTRKTYKNRVFLRWSSKNVKKQKNGFLEKIA